MPRYYTKHPQELFILFDLYKHFLHIPTNNKNDTSFSFDLHTMENKNIYIYFLQSLTNRYQAS